jgi:hypothetical protein
MPRQIANGLPPKSSNQTRKKKKRKYLDPYLERRHQFTPFVCSVDGLLGKEATTSILLLPIFGWGAKTQINYITGGVGAEHGGGCANQPISR